MLFQERFGTRQILRGVDPHGLGIRDAHTYFIAVFQPPQLFERLGQLQRRLRQGRDLAQHLRAEGVNADVLVEGVLRQPLPARDVPQVGNHRTRKIDGLRLRIEHHLAALPGQRITDISEVRSHPIALMQCEDFLDNHRYMRAVESEDTALAAQDIAVKGLRGTAAICSRLAADQYGLEVLAAGIETNKRNFTRFLIVAQPELARSMTQGEQVDKATLVFTLPHEEGSLSKVLTILSFYHNNLTKIQSLPIIGKEWEYQFYINLTFTDYTRYRQSLDAIRPLVSGFQNLGEYKACNN